VAERAAGSERGARGAQGRGATVPEQAEGAWVRGGALGDGSRGPLAQCLVRVGSVRVLLLVCARVSRGWRRAARAAVPELPAYDLAASRVDDRALRTLLCAAPPRALERLDVAWCPELSARGVGAALRAHLDAAGARGGLRATLRELRVSGLRASGGRFPEGVAELVELRRVVAGAPRRLRARQLARAEPDCGPRGQTRRGS